MLWVRYPKQIAAGLRSEYPGTHIRQWLCGEMSSREFMELVEGMSYESWFKQSLNADLKQAKLDERRAEMADSAADFEGRFRGEIRTPWDMTVEVVDKRTLTVE